MNIYRLMAVICLLIVSCGPQPVPLDETNNAPYVSDPDAKIVENVQITESGALVSTPNFYDFQSRLSEQNVRHECTSPYDFTGVYARLQTDQLDPANAGYAYQRWVVSPPTKDDLNIFAYKNRSGNNIWPGIYFYGGGVGSGSNGVAVDGGLGWDPVTQSWGPYVQIERANPPAQSMRDSAENYYRLQDNSKLTVESYGLNGKFYIKYMPEKPWVVYDKSGVKLAQQPTTTQSYNFPAPGWINNPPAGSTATTSGQPLKFATSIAYNYPQDVYNTLAPQFKAKFPSLPNTLNYYLDNPKALGSYTNSFISWHTAAYKQQMLSWIASRNDYSLEMNWQEQSIGKVDGAGNLIANTLRLTWKKVNIQPFYCATNSIDALDTAKTQYKIHLPKAIITGKISDPLPNPLPLMGTVGKPVSGSFSFSNVGDALSVLTYIISAPGINITPSSGTLTGKVSQSIAVNVTCATAGDSVYPLSIASNDRRKDRGTISLQVKLSCVAAPKLLTAAPNSIIALVGETKSTTFDISNIGDPGSTLTYTLSPSSGLSLSKNSGSLVKSTGPTAADPKESITASYACTMAGIVTPAPTVTINSNDPNRSSVVETVNVECKQGGPRITDLTPVPINFSMMVGETKTIQLTFKNSGDSVLSYTISDGIIDYTFYTTHEFYIDKRFYSNSVAPGATETINITTTCPNRRGRTNGVATIQSNDPNNPISIQMIRVCNVGPAPEPIWEGNSSQPTNNDAIGQWSQAACGYQSAVEVWDYTGLSLPDHYSYQVGVRPWYQDLGYVRDMYVGYYQWFSNDPATEWVRNYVPYQGIATNYWHSFAAECAKDNVTFTVGK